MIKITFPDGSVREYEAGVTGLEIAQSISSRLAQDVVACGVNGETTELNRPIQEDATIHLYKMKRASMPFGIPVPTCSLKLCRSSIPAFSSVSDLPWRMVSSTTCCFLMASR